MKTLNDLARKAVVALFASIAVFVSCNNENELNNEGNEDEFAQMADSLDGVFAAQADAMRALAGDPQTGLSYAVIREDGDCLAALTGDLTFISYADDVDYYGLLSCHVENGTAYWALSDKDGNAEPLKDGSGNMIPVAEDVKVKLTSAGYKILAAGKEFDTVFAKDDKVQAFVCDFHMDAESRVYAVTFVLGPDDERTLYSRGYTGVGFLPPYGENPDYVSDYYVNYASTSSVILEIPAGVSYSLEVTQGWTAVARPVESVTYVDITAPAADDAAEGAVLKVVSQECGVVLAELTLLNEPFRSIFASAGDVFVEPFAGVRKFVYGVSELEAFDAEAVIAAAAGIVAGTSEPGTGYVLAEESAKSSLSELLGTEMDPDKRYILWALPALYREGEQAGYYVEGSSLCRYEFGAMVFDMDLVEAKILDAQISVVVKGVDAVYGGIVPKSDDALELVASRLRNQVFSPIQATDGQFAYNGMMSLWPASGAEKNEVQPSTSYLVWVAPALSGDYPYEVADIVTLEVTTGDVVEGGSVEVALGDVTTTRNSMSVQVDAPGAAMIYYAVVSNTDGKTYSGADVPNIKKYELLQKNSPVAAVGTSVVAIGEKLKPNTIYWIFAVAVDAEGKYGQVACVSGKTGAVVYDNTITLTVASVSISASKAVFKVTSDGGDLSDYIYWVGRATDPFWANTSYCGKNVYTGQQYMSLNPDDENIKKAMNKYGPLAADGTITVDEMTMETEYVFIILEKGEAEFSKAGYVKVTTLSADLGTIVREGTEKWNTAKESVQISWKPEKFEQGVNGLMSKYAFDFKCPENLTAYVLCASDKYFESAEITRIEHQMIEIEKQASRKYPVNTTPRVNGELASEPDYYKNGVLYQGQMMNVYDFYAHGVPQEGFVTIFANGAHDEHGCPAWESGQCTNYQAYVESIARYKTMEPWRDRAKSFGLTGQEAEDWSAALLEAYSEYYADAKPIVIENDGQAVEIGNPYATGVNAEGVIPDRVFVMFKDLDNNYYEPMWFEVENHFKTQE